MKEKRITWKQVPDHEKERLRAREAAQRSETRNRGMRVEFVDVGALFRTYVATTPKTSRSRAALGGGDD